LPYYVVRAPNQRAEGSHVMATRKFKRVARKLKIGVKKIKMAARKFNLVT
jgi:hypothetical protein